MNQTPEERLSEQPAIELFQKMGYGYLDGSNLAERNDTTEVLLERRLLDAIKRINPWIDENNLHKAYNSLTSINGASLMEINQKVWELIRGATLTLKQEIDGEEEYREVGFID